MTARLVAASALVALACAAPASASASASGDLGKCVQQLVLVAEPVPETPEEHVAAAVRYAGRVVAFAGCVA